MQTGTCILNSEEDRLFKLQFLVHETLPIPGHTFLVIVYDHMDNYHYFELHMSQYEIGQQFIRIFLPHSCCCGDYCLNEG